MHAKCPDCGVDLQQVPNQIVDFRVLLTMVLFAVCLAVLEADAQNPLGLRISDEDKLVDKSPLFFSGLELLSH
jgi:hypothetical protein